MIVPFYKYHGTGNDFVIVNQMLVGYLKNPSRDLVMNICRRRYGVGADGLIILQKSEFADFKMTYFNADGGISTMCGNGGRCLVHLARDLRLFDYECTFEAADGLHQATVSKDGMVSLRMNDVHGFHADNGRYIVDTGSPHMVVPKESVTEVDVFAEGKALRNEEPYKLEGINVNFVENNNAGIHVRTYERGVEDETLSCGTGVTACALMASEIYDDKRDLRDMLVETTGGRLKVNFAKAGQSFTDIWLTGPAVKVFEGQLTL